MNLTTIACAGMNDEENIPDVKGMVVNWACNCIDRLPHIEDDGFSCISHLVGNNIEFNF